MENVIYVFIDASNLWEAQKAKGKFLDYKKLHSYIEEKFIATQIVVFYYTAYPADGTRPYSLDGKHKFFVYLEKGLGFKVTKKKLKQIRTIDDSGERIEEKGNMDVEITIDAILYSERYNTAIFFTGDCDFLPLVSYLKSIGKRVYVFSSKDNISEELRTGSNGYTDVLKINYDIWGRELIRRE